MLGAVLTFVLGRLLAERQQRVQATLALVQEFHTESMLTARVKAHKCLPVRPSPVKFADMREDADQAAAVSRVLHFFDNLRILHGAKLVEPTLVTALFKQYVKAWNSDYLLKVELEANDEWEKLLTSLRTLATEFGDRTETEQSVAPA